MFSSVRGRRLVIVKFARGGHEYTHVETVMADMPLFQLPRMLWLSAKDTLKNTGRTQDYAEFGSKPIVQRLLE